MRRLVVGLYHNNNGNDDGVYGNKQKTISSACEKCEARKSFLFGAVSFFLLYFRRISSSSKS